MTSEKTPFAALGTAMRKAREEADLTQEAAVPLLGTNQTQLSRYESGQREAPLSFVQKAEAVYRQPIISRLPPSGYTPPAPPKATVRESAPEGASWQGDRIRPEDVPGVLLAVEEMALTLASLSRRSRLASGPELGTRAGL